MKSALKGLAALPGELFRAAILLAAFGSALVALFAQFGLIDPLMDVFGHFALAGAYVSALALIFGLLIRRRGRMPWALSLAGLLLWSVLLIPDLFAAVSHPRGAAPGGDQIKIVQFNVWGANNEVEKTARWILAQKADVVTLEETVISSPLVQALKSGYPNVRGCYDPYPCSTVVMTRERPLRGGGEAIPFGKANLAWVEMQGAKGPYVVVGVHHSWPYPVGAQPAQIPWSASVLARFEPKSLIFAGDFNATPWAYTLRRQDRAYGLIRRTHALPTFPARIFSRRPMDIFPPLLALDHVYAGEAWQTVSVKRGPQLGSDHYPVVVELAR